MSYEMIPLFIQSIKAEEIEFLEFYRYRTVVNERIFSLRYDEKHEFMDKIFKDIITKADDINFVIGDSIRTGKQLRDNKTAFKVKLKSGTIVFVGYYDGARHIGLSVESDNWITPLPVQK